MSSEAIFNTIKKTVKYYLPDCRILLFGSRAKGNEDKYSDNDLIIITPKTFSRTEKTSWTSRLDRAIVEAIHAPVDLLIFSEEEML